MKLYSLPLSPYAARVRGSIYAKGLPVEIVTPSADWRASAEYRALNPMMRIPVLVLDDGTTLPESRIIVDYLEEAFPEPPLRPRSAEASARMRLIPHIAELYVVAAMMPLFFLYDATPRDEAAIDAQLGKLDQGLGYLDALLKPGGYAFGSGLTLADTGLVGVRFALDGLMGFSGRSELLDRYKAVAAYRDVIQADPVLSRVWGEMAEGLKSFMAARAAGAA